MSGATAPPPPCPLSEHHPLYQRGFPEASSKWSLALPIGKDALIVASTPTDSKHHCGGIS